MTYPILIQQLQRQIILPLFYHKDASVCKAVVHALYAAGVRIIEFTNRGTAAKERFRELVQLRDNSMPDMMLAIGTVRNEDDMHVYSQLGADVFISPYWDDAVAQYAQTHQKIWVPGCMTPSEVHRAENAGIFLVKLFPGNVLTTGFVTAIRPLFPNMHFVVTGGVEAQVQSIAQWLTCGVCAVGLGSNLISKEIVSQQDFSLLQHNVATLLQQLKQINHQAT